MLGIILMSGLLSKWWFWMLIAIIIYSSAKGARQPMPKRKETDFLKLKQIFASFGEKIIPWKKEESELLCLNVIEPYRNKKEGFEGGAFGTIYQEPLVYFGGKEYTNPLGHGVFYAKTQTDEFFYNKERDTIRIRINGVEVGTLFEGKLRDKTGKLIAEYDNPIMEAYTAIQIEGKDVGHVLKLDTTGNDVTPRGLDLVDPEMTDDQMRIFQALAIWQLLKDNFLN